MSDAGHSARYDRIVTASDLTTSGSALSGNTSSEITPSGQFTLVQSFALTGAADPDGGDILATRETAVPWLVAAGLMPSGASLTGSEHGALLRLRDAIAEYLTPGRAANPDLAARLTRALSDGRLVVTIADGGAVRLHTAARSVYPSIVAALAAALSDAHYGGLLHA
jgi:hypothetical protein